MTEQSRYIIGVDLGTTNTAVAYIDTTDPLQTIRSLPIKQISKSGLVEERSQLPSACYLFGQDSAPPLPWQREKRSWCVGEYAYHMGGKTPTRYVHSAKSWLCHSAADRKSPILPREAFDDRGRISPVEATARYLLHIKEGWDATIGTSDPDSEFDQQDVVLTVPASFDEVARTLTAQAAKMAGFSHLTLLEEPQSAFYHWISSHEAQGFASFNDGETILVCDVGGGTTDFSLIRVQGGGFERVATGNHLLLGGYNMDVALAFFVEEKMHQEEILPKRREFTDDEWARLCFAVCEVKEQLLAASSEKALPVVLHGSGSGVVSGSLSCQLQALEVQKLLKEGFFGDVSYQEALRLRQTGGIKTMGLPFEDEPSIIKHMALFLHKAGDIAPDHILFNGGTMVPTLFQEAVSDALKRWYPEKNLQILKSKSLALAVSRGAAYYGKVRRGLGVRIASGTTRALYVAVDIDNGTQALTLLPKGSQEGTVFRSEQIFELRANQPIVFQLLGSQTRLDDQSGKFVTIDEEMQPLPPIQTLLRFGKKESTETVQATLEACLTEMGTVELWLYSVKTEHKWRLEFQLRAASGVEDALSLTGEGRQDETFDVTFTKEATEVLKAAFSEKTLPSKEVVRALEDALEAPKEGFPPSILRKLFDELLNHPLPHSPILEARWWNLAGFFLRPGFGYPLDDHRIRALWKVILGSDKKVPDVLVQQWIAFRRIAGGLKRGQQTTLAAPLLKDLFKNVDKNSREHYLYTEKVRTLASFEHLDVSHKKRLGDALLKRILDGKASDVEFWALGRLGARTLLYGPLTHVVPKETVQAWIDLLLPVSDERVPPLLVRLAAKTDRRELNLSLETMEKVEERLQGLERLQELLQVATELTAQEQETLLGDSLPNGLSLQSLS